MNNIIVLATYWDEIEWIDASLDQIEAIDPVEVIICDGCFDDRFENRSSDGTRERIEAYVRYRGASARMISAVRVPRWRASAHLLRGLGRANGLPCGRRLLVSARLPLYKSLYRINQGLTFGHMIQISQAWSPGRWVMTVDADQFYSDEVLDAFSLTKEESDLGLLTADDLTFPFSPWQYVDDYDTRGYANMPHKIYRGTAIYPTRRWFIEGRFRARRYPKVVRSRHVGTYFHYKFRRDEDRLARGYELGDRKRPQQRDPTVFDNLKAFTGSHPRIVQPYLEL